MLTGGRPAGDAATARRVAARLPPGGLFADATGAPLTFRIPPEPFPLAEDLVRTIAAQGRLWLAFLQAAQRLYLASRAGDLPAWIAGWLDAGKPERLLAFGRMNRFKRQFPALLRPDLLWTDDGLVATELDSVPGGFGLLAALSRAYEAEGFACAGAFGTDGMVEGFARALAHAAGRDAPATAIVVSDESRMYRPEMDWLATALRERGLAARAIHPHDLRVGPDGVADAAGRLDVVYRFFELFDLPNVAGADALLEAAKLKRVRLTPPPKAFLEEKLLFALLHHPALTAEWTRELGDADLAALRALTVPTWVLDPAPVPPHAVIPGPWPADAGIQSWAALETLSQRDRALVIKPSGFSPDAWGSRGVRFGFDLSQPEWAAAVRAALAAFPSSPHVLQPYRRPRVTRVRWLDSAGEQIRETEARVRLTPYYWVVGEHEAVLGGILATACPPDKKAIHGMPDAVMAPCAA